MIWRFKTICWVLAIAFTTVSCGAYWQPITDQGVSPIDIDPEYLEGTEVQFHMADRRVLELYVNDVDSAIVTGTVLATRDTMTIDLHDVAEISTVRNTMRHKHVVILVSVVVVVAMMTSMAWNGPLN